ncbi:stonustoxin subunit alpha-like isoform X2 [Carassius auratus]|uniref:Stonustoxin subunit alpha-like isoform X2 n=1 Tax=Carassius auratus TaxID=7957 RepID=A0A6P6MBF6_CARAU|nr:stonustoxin subunit alpha-like isoform X2 [Carassius auratus]
MSHLFSSWNITDIRFQTSSLYIKDRNSRSLLDHSKMAGLLMYLKQPICICFCTYLWLATLALVNAETLNGTETLRGFGPIENTAMTSQAIELAALGRPLFPGMLYDCRKDSFIPGVTLWDKKSLSEDLDIRPQRQTDLKFSSSDSLSSKSNLLDVSASLKVSYLGGLVEVGGSAKYLRDTKSSNQQARVTMHYSETTRFEQLTMTQLGQITYPQVFDQKTATHVVTAVLYGAQAFMVFDQKISEGKCKDEIERELNVMVKKIPGFSIDGEAALQMTDAEKKTAEKIACTFHGDFYLQQNPTTYMEALELYKKLPTLLRDNPQNVVPIKVWLYPLHLLDSKAAQLKRDISTSALSKTVEIMERLDEAERTCNDLFRVSLVNVFSDIKVKLRSFQGSFNIYKAQLVKAVGRVLPAIRGGSMTENTLNDILKIHRSSPFNADKLDLWLNDANTELHLLSSSIKTLKEITIVDSDHINSILINPDIDVVVCLTFTSLQYEDPYLSALEKFLESDTFTEQDKKNTVSVPFVRKWFDDPDVITKMKEDISRFRSFSEANKDEKRIHFIISAISDSSSPGSSIFLYEKGKLTDTKFQLVSKPPPPILKDVISQGVSLKLQKSPTGETVQYRVEYKEVTAGSSEEEQWLAVDTADEDFTLTGLLFEKPYTIRYRIVDQVGVSEASDAVSCRPSHDLPQIVGGDGGFASSFVTPSISTIKKIRIYYQEIAGEITWFKSIQVTFSAGHIFTIGDYLKWKVKEFLFDNDDKIVNVTLWPNTYSDRFRGLEFVVEKSNGTRTTFSIKCKEVGDPVSVDVKSGKCYGITARSGSEIDSLGFYFF